MSLRALRGVLSVAVLGACGSGSGSTEPHTASWKLSGVLSGTRSADDTAGGRATCTVATDPDEVVTGRPFLTLAFTDAGGANLRLVVHDWSGTGTYAFSSSTPGVAVVSDRDGPGECARGSDRCYVASSGCQVTITAWTLDEVVAPGAQAGTAKGQVACAALENGAQKKVAVKGTFSCRASDWTR